MALAWPNHVHHEAAHSWFRDEGGKRWATCPLTQSGFVRVSSNRSVIAAARSPGEALELLRQMTGLPGHLFWDDTISLVDSPEVAREKLHGHRQVADAHLLAIALRHGGAVATFDRGLRGLVPDGVEPESAVRWLDSR